MKNNDKYKDLIEKIELPTKPPALTPARNHKMISNHQKLIKEHKDKCNKILQSEKKRKINLVFEKYGFSSKQKDWEKLCLKLCEEHFIGFSSKEIDRNNYKKKWDTRNLAILFCEVELELIKNTSTNPNYPKPTVGEIAIKLANSKRWKDYISSASREKRIKRIRDLHSKAKQDKSIKLFIQHLEYLKTKPNSNQVIELELQKTIKSLK